MDSYNAEYEKCYMRDNNPHEMGDQGRRDHGLEGNCKTCHGEEP